MNHFWDREGIKAELRRRGTSLAELARRNDKDRSAMARSLVERLPSYNRIVADALGLTMHDLWPQWYCRSDRPRGRSRPDVTRRALEGEEAA
jgi:Ner family transcriptional regulator